MQIVCDKYELKVYEKEIFSARLPTRLTFHDAVDYENQIFCLKNIFDRYYFFQVDDKLECILETKQQLYFMPEYGLIFELYNYNMLYVYKFINKELKQNDILTFHGAHMLNIKCYKHWIIAKNYVNQSYYVYDVLTRKIHQFDYNFIVEPGQVYNQKVNYLISFGDLKNISGIISKADLEKIALRAESTLTLHEIEPYMVIMPMPKKTIINLLDKFLPEKIINEIYSFVDNYFHTYSL